MKKHPYYCNKIKITALFAVIICLIIPANCIWAATPATKLNDLTNQKSSLENDIKNKTAAAKEKEKQAQELAQTIKKIDDDISETEDRINSLNKQISNTQNEIDDTDRQIKEKEQQLKQETENKNNTIRELYKSGKQSTWEMLMSVKTLSEAINNTHYFESLEYRLESTINKINQIRQDLENQQKSLNDKKNELLKLKDEQLAYKQSIDLQKKEKDAVLKDAKAQQKSYEQQVAEAKKLNSQIEAEIASIQASLRNSGGSGVTVARDKGTSSVGFSWPMDYKYISCYYGESTPFQSFHTGIDLVNIQGTPIYAAANGTVVSVKDMMINGNYYGYGKYVVIGHNAKYSSLYGHMMNYTVSQGQEVKAGDIIGYEGNTGYSTGPHLHFEIWENGNRVNPINYLP